MNTQSSRQMICQQAPDPGGGQSQKEWQSREEGGFFQGHATILHEVGREPGDVELPHERGSERRPEEAPKADGVHYGPPGFQVPWNGFLLGERFVAIQGEPRGGGGDSQQSEEPEHSPPAEVDEQDAGGKRRDSAAEAAASQEEAEGGGALVDWDPTAEGGGDRGR